MIFQTLLARVLPSEILQLDSGALGYEDKPGTWNSDKAGWDPDSASLTG